MLQEAQHAALGPVFFCDTVAVCRFEVSEFGVLPSSFSNVMSESEIRGEKSERWQGAQEVLETPPEGWGRGPATAWKARVGRSK